MNHVVRTTGVSYAGNAVLWTIVSDDGITSGPADLDALKRKAAEGSLTATSKVSTDGKHWIQAAHLPDLEMDWLVLVSQEEVMGPFAFAALEVLRTSGHIPPDAQVFRRQTAPAAGSQGLHLVQRAMSAESQRREAEAELFRIRADLDAKDLEFEAERQQRAAEIARLQADGLRRDAEIASLKSESNQLSTSLEGREALEALVVDGERELSQTREKCDALQHQIETLRGEQSAVRRELEQARQALALRTTDERRQLEQALALLAERNRHLMTLAEECKALATVPLPEPAGPTASNAEEKGGRGTEPQRPPEPTRTVQRSAAEPAACARRVARKPPTGNLRPPPEPAVDVEVLPPDKAGARPFVRAPDTLHPEKLAALEAQAQQELARLRAGKTEPAFWNRRTRSA